MYQIAVQDPHRQDAVFEVYAESSSEDHAHDVAVGLMAVQAMESRVLAPDALIETLAQVGRPVARYHALRGRLAATRRAFQDVIVLRTMQRGPSDEEAVST